MLDVTLQVISKSHRYGEILVDHATDHGGNMASIEWKEFSFNLLTFTFKFLGYIMTKDEDEVELDCCRVCHTQAHPFLRQVDSCQVLSANWWQGEAMVSRSQQGCKNQGKERYQGEYHKSQRYHFEPDKPSQGKLRKTEGGW